MQHSKPHLLTIPLGPSVDLIRSPMAMAPTKADYVQHIMKLSHLMLDRDQELLSYQPRSLGPLLFRPGLVDLYRLK